MTLTYALQSWSHGYSYFLVVSRRFTVDLASSDTLGQLTGNTSTAAAKMPPLCPYLVFLLSVKLNIVVTSRILVCLF